MSRAIKAEFLKFFSTRLWWGMAIAMFLSGAAFAVLFALILTSEAAFGEGGLPLPLSDAQLTRTVFTTGISVGYLLTLSIGVLMVGSEYRHQTITSTFLAIPRRATVMAAKTVALLAIGAFYGLLSLAGSVTTGAIILSAKGREPFADPAIWRTLGLSLLVLGLWALIGLGAGILIPNQVAALLIAVGVAWIVEPIVSAVLPLTEWGKQVAPYLPTQATNSTLDIENFGFAGPIENGLTWWGGALVLAAYAALMAGLGTWRTLRADIS
jgi:ABC-type transport system involved in multi-copper enzyme maturation permease subunit